MWLIVEYQDGSRGVGVTECYSNRYNWHTSTGRNRTRSAIFKALGDGVHCRAWSYKVRDWWINCRAWVVLVIAAAVLQTTDRPETLQLGRARIRYPTSFERDKGEARLADLLLSTSVPWREWWSSTDTGIAIDSNLQQRSWEISNESALRKKEEKKKNMGIKRWMDECGWFKFKMQRKLI